MLTGTAAIDQAIIEAMQVADMRPAIIRPYLEFGDIPSAEKALKDYYQDKNFDKKLAAFAGSVAELEQKLAKFLARGEEIRTELGASFADNKANIEPRHLDNLETLSISLESTAHENSAEEVALLKRLDKNIKQLGRKKPKYKTQARALFDRIFAVGDAKTEELYNMALFLRALRAVYDEDKEQSAYFDNSEDMLTYLKGLAA